MGDDSGLRGRLVDLKERILWPGDLVEGMPPKPMPNISLTLEERRYNRISFP